MSPWRSRLRIRRGFGSRSRRMAPTTTGSDAWRRSWSGADFDRNYDVTVENDGGFGSGYTEGLNEALLDQGGCRGGLTWRTLRLLRREAGLSVSMRE
jgi:hypothetical protein